MNLKPLCPPPRPTRLSPLPFSPSGPYCRPCGALDEACPQRRADIVAAANGESLLAFKIVNN